MIVLQAWNLDWLNKQDYLKKFFLSIASVKLELSQSAHSPIPGGRGRTSQTSSGRNFRQDVPVWALTDKMRIIYNPLRVVSEPFY